MRYSFHWNQVWKNVPDMLSGAWMTLQLAVLSMLIGMAVAIVLVLLRNSKSTTLVTLAKSIIEVGRNTPALFQIYMIYFGLGALEIPMDSYPALLIGISFNNACYLAETLRGGLRAIPETQMRSARSLGMSAPMAFSYIIMPQLLRISFYPISNQLIWAMLTTSLGVVVGLGTDLTGVTHALNTKTFRTFEYFAVAAVMYYALAKFLTISTRLLAARLFRY